MLAAIEAREIHKTYPGGVRALDGFTLSVQAGTVFALLGPNGAGKSTATKVLTTLSVPDRGEAKVAGYDFRRQADQVRRSIGYVAQRSGADGRATGRENLMMQGRLYGLAGGQLDRRVDE